MGAGAKVFLVEDSPDLRFLYRLMLERAGYDLVGETSSGAEALAQVEALAPDVIVLDLLLPDGRGSELIDRFRALLPGVRIILCSGAGGNLAAGAGARADGWLDKVQSFELVPILDRLLA